jgi:dihydroorotase
MVGITCTTTAVSAGDAGANTWGAFYHLALPQSRTRLFSFIHIASIGLAGGLAPGEMLNIDYADVDRCAKVVAENPETVLGVKVRITDSVVGQNGLEPLRRALRAAELAGHGARVMCHIGAAPGNLSDLLDLLRPGDILTHSYSGAGNNTVQNGRLLPAALAAKKRGVIIDVGHGGGSFDFTVAEPAMQQGMTPDTISSDIHSVSINTPGYPTLPWVMSKFLALGCRSRRWWRGRPGSRPRSSAASPASGRFRSARPPTSRSWSWSMAPWSSWTPATTSAAEPGSSFPC